MDSTDEDGGTVVPVTDFERARAALRDWCGEAGSVERRRRDGVAWVVCEFGRARFAVGADGRVEGGMPLHGFEGRAERLVVADDAVRVLGPDLEYVFRRP